MVQHLRVKARLNVFSLVGDRRVRRRQLQIRDALRQAAQRQAEVFVRVHQRRKAERLRVLISQIHADVLQRLDGHDVERACDRLADARQAAEFAVVVVVRFGADICVSGKWPYSIIADLAYAQLRRYTEYNHNSTSGETEISAFQKGDIYIDPARRKVEVRGRPVSLRPREFSLLLYFMRNPDIVLTSEQICEHAWGMEGIYNQGVSHPVRLLRQIIEPDPLKPVYIETVYRVGYRFTAYHSETCDIC